MSEKQNSPERTISKWEKEQLKKEKTPPRMGERTVLKRRKEDMK